MSKAKFITCRFFPMKNMLCEDVKKKTRSWPVLTNSLRLLAGSMGFEPTASGVTGRRYNQLNYDPETKMTY
jgi:hypothetical protein